MTSTASSSQATLSAVQPQPLTRTLIGGVVTLWAMDIAGAFISVSEGLNSSFSEALGSTGRLSAPLTFMAVQAILLFVATRRRRGLSVPATALFTVAGVLSFMSGFSDGGYAASMGTGPRIFQIVLVAAHLIVGVIAAVRVALLLRRKNRAV